VSALIVVPLEFSSMKSSGADLLDRCPKVRLVAVPAPLAQQAIASALMNRRRAIHV
jgi:hypothetical protein